MKYIKTYEKYNSSGIDTISIQNILNNDKFTKIVTKLYDSLPGRLKTSLINYITSNKINVDKIEKTIEKYNLRDKVKRLYDKGITSIQDIYNRITGKNESIVGIVVIFLLGIICIIAGFIYLNIGEGHSFISFILGIILVIMGTVQVTKYIDDKFKDKIEGTDKIGNYVNVPNKTIQKDTIIANRNSADFIVDGHDIKVTVVKKVNGDFIINADAPSLRSIYGHNEISFDDEK
jgi:hypothetical protein